MLIRRVVALSLALPLALAGCGGGGGTESGAGPTAPPSPGSPTSPTAPTTPSTTASIAMRTDGDGYGSFSSSFLPSAVTIARGGTVTWTNGTDVAHNVTFDAAAGAPANVADNTTGSASRTFATAGTFGFHCTNHVGMAGSITVSP